MRGVPGECTLVATPHEGIWTRRHHSTSTTPPTAIHRRYTLKLPHALHRYLVASPHALAFGPDGALVAIGPAPLLRLLAELPAADKRHPDLLADPRDLARLLCVAREAVLLARYGTSALLLVDDSGNNWESGSDTPPLPYNRQTQKQWLADRITRRLADRRAALARADRARSWVVALVLTRRCSRASILTQHIMGWLREDPEGGGEDLNDVSLVFSAPGHLDFRPGPGSPAAAGCERSGQAIECRRGGGASRGGRWEPAVLAWGGGAEEQGQGTWQDPGYDADGAFTGMYEVRRIPIGEKAIEDEEGKEGKDGAGGAMGVVGDAGRGGATASEEADSASASVGAVGGTRMDGAVGFVGDLGATGEVGVGGGGIPVGIPVDLPSSSDSQQVANKVPFARLRPPRFSGAEAETASRGLLARWDDLVYFYRRFNPPKAHAGVVRRIVLRYKTVANMNEALRSAYEGADLDHKSRRPATYYPSMLVPFEPESPGLSTFGVRSLTSRLVPSSDDPLEREWHIVCRVHSALVADMDDMDYCTGASLDC